MSTQPAYASNPIGIAALLGTAETNLQVPVHASQIVASQTNGAKIEEIVVQASQTTLVATTVAGLVYLFQYDGTNYHLFDTIVVGAVTASATVAPVRLSRVYNNLELPNGTSLYASQSIAGNANILQCFALGGAY